MASSFVSIVNCAAGVDFCVNHQDRGGAGFTRVAEFVAARGHLYKMDFGFLWNNVANKVCLSNLTTRK